MANNKITQLNSLVSSSLSGNDLFVVVDVDDLSSPTGETKNIKASELQSYFSNESDTGTVQEIFDWDDSYDLFLVGHCVKINSAGILELADTKTADDSEAVGIIADIVDEVSVKVIYSGKITFTSAVMYEDSGGNLVTDDLDKSTVYFLSEDGYMRSIDPSENNTGWISKPMMIGYGPTEGLVLNYRGLVNSGPDLAPKPYEYFINDTDCYDFQVGDVIRRTHTEEGRQEWVLSSADTLVDSEVVGVVTERSTTYIRVGLVGYINGLSGLEAGKVYYLTPQAANSELELPGFDITRTGRRNVMSYTPVCPYFSKPVYIAISSTEAVILNHRTLPNTTLDSTQCQSGDQGKFRGTYLFNRDTKPGTGSEDATALLATYATFVVNNPISGDTVEIYWVNPTNPNDTNKQKWSYKYLNGAWAFQSTCSCATP